MFLNIMFHAPMGRFHLNQIFELPLFQFSPSSYSIVVLFPVGLVGLGGLRVTCSPRDPRFAGSNPTEVDGFFQDVNILSTSPPGGTLSWGSRV